MTSYQHVEAPSWWRRSLAVASLRVISARRKEMSIYPLRIAGQLEGPVGSLTADYTSSRKLCFLAILASGRIVENEPYQLVCRCRCSDDVYTSKVGWETVITRRTSSGELKQLPRVDLGDLLSNCSDIYDTPLRLVFSNLYF